MHAERQRIHTHPISYTTNAVNQNIYTHLTLLHALYMSYLNNSLVYGSAYKLMGHPDGLDAVTDKT